MRDIPDSDSPSWIMGTQTLPAELPLSVLSPRHAPPVSARADHRARATEVFLAAQDGTGGFLASPDTERYPFVYPRDMVFICKALLRLGRAEDAKRAYEFLARTQLRNGEWVQRYGRGGDPQPSREMESDVTGLVLHGIWDLYAHTGDRAFLERLWPHVDRATQYISSVQDDVSGLVLSHHSVHEYAGIEEGAEVWANSWCARGLADAAAVAEVLQQPAQLASSWRESAERVRRSVLTLLWDGRKGTFAKVLRSNGSIDTNPDVSCLAPAWAHLVRPTDDRVRLTAQLLVGNLRHELGGFVRFKKWESTRDWHWYDGGFGPWVIWTLRMCRTLAALGENEQASEALHWVLAVASANRGLLPEHIATSQELQEWRENDRDVGQHVSSAYHQALERQMGWSWNGRASQVTSWVLPLCWSHAELVLTLEDPN